MWTETLWHNGPPAIQWGIALTAALTAAVSDVRTRRIPNWLTGPVFAAGVVYAAIVGGAAGLADSLAASVVLALPYVVLFMLGGGAGDAKLMGAIGAWVGLVNGIVVLAAVALAGVFLAIGHAMAKGEARSVATHVARAALSGVFRIFARGWRMDLPDPKHMSKMPYGVAIFTGVCLAAGAVLIWRTALT